MDDRSLGVRGWDWRLTLCPEQTDCRLRILERTSDAMR